MPHGGASPAQSVHWTDNGSMNESRRSRSPGCTRASSRRSARLRAAQTYRRQNAITPVVALQQLVHRTAPHGTLKCCGRACARRRGAARPAHPRRSGPLDSDAAPCRTEEEAHAGVPDPVCRRNLLARRLRLPLVMPHRVGGRSLAFGRCSWLCFEQRVLAGMHG